MSEPLMWLALGGLGAFHGLNPAMGWLFAVALGLQERRRGAVLQAFTPIALGHALSVALVVLVIGLAGRFVDLELLRYAVAGILILFGLYKLVRRNHPRWVGMRVGFRDLTAWSFLMASAHGAGLMLAPVLMTLEPSGNLQGHSHAGPLVHAGLAASPAVVANVTAVLVHTLGMFVVMALVAILVYDKLGVMILRRAWINLDLLWIFALAFTGLLTLALIGFD